MRSVLVLLAHPAMQKSRVNRPLAEAAAQVPGVTLHDLYENYPQFHIDVPREQALLLQHDLFVFQYPLFWFGPPSLLKEWMDVVLTLGFAYGPHSQALRGKRAAWAISAGGSEAMYQPEGANGHTVAELLLPMKQAMLTCGLELLPPRIIYATHRLQADDLAQEAHAYARWLAGLKDSDPSAGWPAAPGKTNQDGG